VWRPIFEPFKRTKTTSTKHKQNLKLEGKASILNYLHELKGYLKNDINTLTIKRSRTVKSLNIYKTIIFNKGVAKNFKRTDIKGFIKYMGISKSTTTRFISFTPDYIGIQPSKPIIKHNYISEFVHENYSFLKQNLSHQFFNQLNESAKTPRICFTGSYDTAVSHLQTIISDNPSNVTDEHIYKVLSCNNFGWFNVPKVNLNTPEDLAVTTHLNIVSSPGHYFKKIIGHTKGSVLPYSLPIAHTLLTTITQEPTKNLYLWQVLGREKDIKLNQPNGTSVSTRIVLNTEAPATLLLCNFAQKITRSIIRPGINNKFDTKDEFNQNKYYKYHLNNSKYDFYVDADWQNFDANVDTQFITIAMSIMLSEIASIDDANKRICYYIMSSIITKYVAIPPGVVVEINKSVPSGHPFTTLCNCFVNIIYWSLIGYELYGENYSEMMDITVYGDDALVWFKNTPKLKDIDTIISNIGIKSEPIFPNLFPCFLSSDIHETPDFLKRRFNDLEILWNTKKMFDRLFYQTKNRTIIDQLDLPFSYLTTAPFDDDLFKFCQKLLKYFKLKYSYEIPTEVFDKYEKILNELDSIKLRILDNVCEDKKAYDFEKTLMSYSSSEFIPHVDQYTHVIRNDKLLFGFFNQFSHDPRRMKKDVINKLLQMLYKVLPRNDTCVNTIKSDEYIRYGVLDTT